MARYDGPMSRAGILLRITLALALVLNGVAGPVAAATMAAAATSAGHEGVPSAMHDGCHEHAGMSHRVAHSPSTDGARKSPAGHADCCGIGLCGCACAQLSSLAAYDALLVPATLQHERFVGPTALARPSPTLPHLIRPPIV